MAYDFGQALLNLVGGQPIDLRTPQTQQIERSQIGNIRQLQQEYANAVNNPDYGIGAPGDRATAEQQIMNDVMSKTGASGAGQSGYERNAVASALATFRLQTAAQRQQALNQL